MQEARARTHTCSVLLTGQRPGRRRTGVGGGRRSHASQTAAGPTHGASLHQAPHKASLCEQKTPPIPADTFLNDILAMSTLRHPHLYLPGSRRTASTLNNFTLDLTRTPRVLSPVCQLRREVTTAARGSAGTITTYTGANPSRGRKSVKKAKYKQRETCGVYTCDASCAVPSPLTSQPERTT